MASRIWALVLALLGGGLLLIGGVVLWDEVVGKIIFAVGWVAMSFALIMTTKVDIQKLTSPRDLWRRAFRLTNEYFRFH
jgi:hypothetical protein